MTLKHKMTILQRRKVNTSNGKSLQLLTHTGTLTKHGASAIFLPEFCRKKRAALWRKTVLVVDFIVAFRGKANDFRPCAISDFRRKFPAGFSVLSQSRGKSLNYCFQES